MAVFKLKTSCLETLHDLAFAVSFPLENQSFLRALGWSFHCRVVYIYIIYFIVVIVFLYNMFVCTLN